MSQISFHNDGTRRQDKRGVQIDPCRRLEHDKVISDVDPVTSVGQTVSLVCLVMDSGWKYCRARYEADRGKAFKNIHGKIDPSTQTLQIKP